MPKQRKISDNEFFELSDEDLPGVEAEWLELNQENFNHDHVSQTEFT